MSKHTVPAPGLLQLGPLAAPAMLEILNRFQAYYSGNAKESGIVLVLDSGHEVDSQMENLVCMAESLEER